MLRSLYSGVSGMRSFQTKMDVIANNVANVNTTAFKSSRAKFQDMLSQTSANAQSPMPETGQGFNLGGINAQQVGLGVKVGAIDNIMTGGSLQPTNRALDFAIENEGFFVVKENAMAENVYTRDGGFYTDHEGNVVNANGYRVMGYGYDNLTSGGAAIPGEDQEDESEIPLKEMRVYRHLNLEDLEEIEDNVGTDQPYGDITGSPDDPDFVVGDETFTLQDFTIDGTGLIKGVYSRAQAVEGGEDGETEAEVRYVNIGKLSMAIFNNPEGLEKVGNNNFVQSNNSGTAEIGQAGTAGYGSIRQGFLEMSNVDLANEFTEMIVASRAYQANSRSITTSDEMIQELINLKR